MSMSMAQPDAEMNDAMPNASGRMAVRMGLGVIVVLSGGLWFGIYGLVSALLH